MKLEGRRVTASAAQKSGPQAYHVRSARPVKCTVDYILPARLGHATCDVASASKFR
jgi:hypothetical protein